MRSYRAVAAIALAVTTATAVAACGGSSSSSSSGSTNSTSSTGKVTLTWWNNGTTQPILGVWQSVVSSFHAAHPNVTIKNVPIQNEQFTTKMPLALESGTPPDIYQQWGGGQMATQIKSGKLVNITSSASGWISELGNAAAGWQVSGQQYGTPYDLHAVGFWYRKDLFAKAGIASPPATLPQLETDITMLKAHNIVPVSVGSKDRWPDAFWWEYFAVRECSTSVLKQSMSSINLSAPCFMKASTDLTAFMKTNPFQTGFLGTAAQQGAGSSAGMLGTGKAAMELQGDWELGTIEGLTSNKNIGSQLGWFPFPTVPGGAGDPKTILGGGDGYSCTTGAAEPACEQFLQYLDSVPVQKQILAAGAGLPANQAAAPALSSPTLQQVFAANQSAPYIQTYFDIAFPTQPGQKLDSAVADFFAGQGSAQSVIQSVSGPA